MKEIKLFDNKMILKISKEDWQFLCQNRLFSNNPPIDVIEAEFVVGTGITKNKKFLWGNASKCFSEYIKDLRNILFESF